jgi:hypothetical protein
MVVPLSRRGEFAGHSSTAALTWGAMQAATGPLDIDAFFCPRPSSLLD